MKNKSLLIFVFIFPLGILSSCSDFRKAVGKEKVIPDEFSVVSTPSLLTPPGYNIDPQTIKSNDLKVDKNDFQLSKEIEIKENKEYNKTL